MSRHADDETLRKREDVTPDIEELAWSAASSTGSKRANNQDYWGARGGRRFVVADGVGGTAGGEMASAAAVSKFLDLAPQDDWVSALTDLNQLVRAECNAFAVPEAATTLVACEVEHSYLHVIHVGDSRAYQLTSHGLHCLTVDHNLGEYRRAQGLHPTPNDETSPRALVSYLGADDDVQVGVRKITFPLGDRLLLCTDGVHEQLDDVHLRDLLMNHPFDEIANQIVDAADAAGGRDNATALVVERQ